MVKLSAISMFLGVFYGAPSRSFVCLPTLVNHIRDKFSCEDFLKFFWVGDFNLPEINWNNCTFLTTYGPDFLFSLQEFGLRQIVKMPTRNRNILDWICLPVNMLSSEPKIIAPPSFTNDHSGEQVRITIKAQKLKRTIKESWFIDQQLVPLFRADLFQIDWPRLFDEKTSSEQALLLEQHLLSVGKVHFERRKMKQISGRPVYSNQVKISIKRINQSYRNFLRVKSERVKV